MKASVSVVMPHFNSEATICRSIDSVVSQSLAVQELIIVDDGSRCTADLKNLVDMYSDKLSIRLILSDQNKGASYARNLGVSLAIGDYIAFLDSDDVWHPDKIKIQYYFMLDNDFSLSAHGYIANLNDRAFPAIGAVAYKVLKRRRFVLGNPIFTPTVMVLRAGFFSFDQRFRRMEDYKCWYENFHRTRVASIDLLLAGGFKHPIGASGLSGAVELMHKDYVAVLKSLYAEDKMALYIYMFARFVEFFKYPVRVFLLKIRRLMSVS
ncbi:glycosyltransferase [Pseudomonas stutzeri]|uniref:glycosyltransferase family 2 protein n=1 Tax=Pseudomonadaceae TaxID=135621 RepID=UPI000697DD29|nr:glycosyltransferase family 2 protein [Pseudomonas sp. 10B238]MBK3796948.1 glycosyltransferase [Stutzerimonas stutzeri]MBK3877451.1 glycosyltransferase [Stutzerimonas stutzeri]HBM09170.1 glycosyltransferase family 2 protein [Pseudomonas sp.]